MNAAEYGNITRASVRSTLSLGGPEGVVDTIAEFAFSGAGKAMAITVNRKGKVSVLRFTASDFEAMIYNTSPGERRLCLLLSRDREDGEGSWPGQRFAVAAVEPMQRVVDVIPIGFFADESPRYEPPPLDRARAAVIREANDDARRYGAAPVLFSEFFDEADQSVRDWVEGQVRSYDVALRDCSFGQPDPHHEIGSMKVALRHTDGTESTFVLTWRVHALAPAGEPIPMALSHRPDVRRVVTVHERSELDR